MATGPTLVFGSSLFPLNKVTSSVGRKDRITNMVPDVDLGTLDTDRSVSRRHAEISYEKGVLSLRDIGSTNGTSVNGERLAHQVDALLKDGDAVAFGSVNMTFAREAEWPEGIEAEWPPEVPEPMAEETMVSAPGFDGAEETMVAAPFGGTEETMMAPPALGTEETMMAPPSLGTEETMMAPPAAGTEALPAFSPADEPPPLPPQPAYAPEPMEAYVACTNHPHMTAVGLCPGCLDPFCVECIPEREDGLMVCNRCAGINYRLSAAGTAS